MSQLFIIFLSFFFLFNPLTIQAFGLKDLNSKREKPSLRQKHMLSDLDFITTLFHISYAPLQWKSDYYGWDLNAEMIKAKSSVLKNPHISTKEFQRIVKDFCLTTKDYHVIPQFYSTEWSILPFHIQSAQGKYFVSFVDDSDFHIGEPFPLSLGDEILTFDGIPIKEAVENFRNKEIGMTYLETDNALAEFYMTNRLGSSGCDIPKGKIEIKFCKPFSNEIKVCNFDWNYHSESITCLGGLLKNKFFHLEKNTQLTQDLYFKKQFTTPHYKLIKTYLADSNEPSDMLGAKRSMVPCLGPVLWESDEECEFHAYLFMMEDSKIGGYIRIPSYYVESDIAALEFAEIIEVFQEASEVLVIDQLNNGGGIILYLYALTAMLTDYPLDVPVHRIMLKQEDVYFAATRMPILESIKSDRSARRALGATLEGVVVNHHLAKCLIKAHEFIVDQWNAGKLLTDFCFMYGIEKIMPHPEVNYTKPILILTNSLDFSAGDFFPAIMQDNQRATIMGTRTAGAGGFIEKVSFPNLSGIEELDITACFAHRPNGKPIENFGVTPDILYEMTQNDLQNNYFDYKKSILTELKILIFTKKIKL